ncbi:hypothetical protein OESDEN_11124 [Oesophagostomum dentatum]|uniref:Uncharacterized protein n=1 Tax=Oesophagostomum dentatum TaxID=61180 RepID=A0A0B1SVT4_OESDE|nr:hypothetical protein OESDEN_11124 [Oesophagostomum dentatum]
MAIKHRPFQPEEEIHSPVERAAAESKISIAHPTLHYTPPPWASIPEPGQGYKLEVVKNGAIVDCIDLDLRKHETFVLIGRLANCDVVMGELPIEVNGIDRAVTAQATVSTSKKDAQVQCALEACRILDAHGVLRRSANKTRTKTKDLEANDFYDDDDDEYLDRTGQIEKQREKRMMWAKNKPGEKVKKSTYESLCKELEETRAAIADLKKTLEDLSKAKAAESTGDSLDDYCRQLNQGVDAKSKTDISILRQKLVGLTHDAQRLEKLVKIAKPVALPELKIAGASTSGADKQAFLRKMMMLGRKKAADAKAAEEEKEGLMKGPAAAPSTVEAFKPEMEEDEEVDKKPDEKPSSSKATNEAAKDDSASSLVREEDKNVAESKSEEKKASIPADSSSASSESSTKENPSKPAPTKTSTTEPALTKTKQQIVHEIVHGDGDEQKIPSKRSISTEGDEDDEEKGGHKKKRRVRVRQNRPAAAAVAGDDYGNGMDDDRYATWLPPENQSGDGKTALNEKFAGRY